MRMMLQSLVPSVEHTEEADLGPKVPGIAGDLQQSPSTSVKQQVIDQPFILQCERSEFPRQGEDDVHVAGRQQLSFPRLEPAQASVALTLGAVPVSARVVRDGSMSAVRALIAMSLAWVSAGLRRTKPKNGDITQLGFLKNTVMVSRFAKGRNPRLLPE